MAQHSPTDWHTLQAAEVLSRVGSSTDGLGEQEAQRRLAQYGANAIPAHRPPSRLRILVRQLNSPIVLLLAAATVAAAALGKVTDALVVLAAIGINAAIGFVQELKASQAIQALSKLIPEAATTLRDGIKRTVPAEGLVPGDVIMLSPGDRVPADARLLETHGVRVTEAALTGESLPADKQTAPVAADAMVGDRRSMVFGGTTVAAGAASAVVTATGAATELGRISSLLEDAEDLQTPLTLTLARVGRLLTYGVVLLSLALFAVGLARGYSVADGLMAAVALAVAAIPEGLPAIITIALAVGVQRMAARRAIVRRLPSVETLGSTTVICTDKTGTLTRNENDRPGTLDAPGRVPPHRGGLHAGGRAPLR
ncbi:MAG: HAD-IC family P-type ATPase [Myxococcales bacterium]